MKKLFYLSVTAIVLCLSACGNAEKNNNQNEETTGSIPNVLFIAVDDLRPELGCYGKDYVISPNIDKLASQGILFNKAYCQVPVCGASRASLLSGIRPTRDRFVNYFTRLEEDFPSAVSLPKHFKQNGYYAISNGKVFHHDDDCEDSWDETPWNPINSHWRDYVVNENVAMQSNGNGPAFESAQAPDTAYRDGKIAAKTVSDLARLKEMGKPFFLAVGFLKPHLPFNAPQKYWELYPEEDIQLASNPFFPENAPKAASHSWGELRAYADIPKDGPVSEEMAKNLVRGYYACVSYTDAMIGKVLNTLDELGLSKNTIVVLWGDHGWNLGEHGLWCKHCNFDNALRAPLVFKVPTEETKKGTTDALVEFVDIYPTLCDLCNLDLPEQLDGSSLVPLMKNPEIDWKKAVYSRWINGESIVTKDFLYTEWFDKDRKTYAKMLYDHKNDPQENANVSELPEHKQRVEKYSSMLKEMNKKSVEKTP